MASPREKGETTRQPDPKAGRAKTRRARGEGEARIWAGGAVVEGACGRGRAAVVCAGPTLRVYVQCLAFMTSATRLSVANLSALRAPAFPRGAPLGPPV